MFKVNNKNIKTITWRCHVHKILLKIAQNSQGNICARVSFLKDIQTKVSNSIKKRDSGTGVFPRILQND